MTSIKQFNVGDKVIYNPEWKIRRFFDLEKDTIAKISERIGWHPELGDVYYIDLKDLHGKNITLQAYEIELRANVPKQ